MADHNGDQLDFTNKIKSRLKSSTVQYSAVPKAEKADHELAGRQHGDWMQRVMLDTWAPEVMAIILSAACMIAIFGVLLAYHNKTTPSLPYGITLNAVVSVLATASETLLLYTVASAIGQLKWCWYQQRERKIQDIQTFDDASRGPWGAVNFVFGPNYRSLASLGAVITVVSLAFDPFVQQILTYPGRTVTSPSSLATAVRATTFNFTADSDEFLQAINAGIWSPASAFLPTPSCPSGNCTWPTFTSIGWCSRCQDAGAYASITPCDISSSVSYIENTTQCNITYGHGKSLRLLRQGTMVVPYDAGQGIETVQNPLLTVDATWILDSTNATGAPYSPPLDNATYLNIVNPVITLGHVTVKIRDTVAAALANGTSPPAGNSLELVRAEECVLSICESAVGTAVTNAVVSANHTADNFGTIQQVPSGASLGNTVTCWSPGSASTLSSDITIHNTSASTVICPMGLTRANVVIMSAADNPITTSYADVIGSAVTGNNTIYIRELLEGNITGTANNYFSSASAYIANHGLASALQGVAASLTHLSQTANTTQNITGTAYVSEVYVSVAWYWLILPVVLVMGAALLLTLAAVQSRGREVRLWKSSLLPFLYHKIGPTVIVDGGLPDTVSGMTSMAGRDVVRL